MVSKWGCLPPFTVVLAGKQLGVFTPRRFRLCRPSFVTLGLFSTQKGLSFSGLDPSLCSLWHRRLPRTGLCLLRGVGALLLSCIFAIKSCDTPRTMPLKTHLLLKRMYHRQNTGVCVMWRLNGGFHSRKKKKSYISAVKTNWHNENKQFWFSEGDPLYKLGSWNVAYLNNVDNYASLSFR